jgi:hypothetical protein
LNELEPKVATVTQLIQAQVLEGGISMPWAPSQQATDGHIYDIYLQDMENSCACACVTMFARLVARGKALGEDTVRRWVKEAEGSVETNFTGTRQFHTTPTGRDLYGAIFKKLRIVSFPVKGQANVARSIPQKVSRAHPAVVSLGWQVWNAGSGAWDREGGHAVLAVNVHNGSVIFLDPAIGVVTIPQADLPLYTVTYPGATNPSFAFMEEMRTTDNSPFRG